MAFFHRLDLQDLAIDEPSSLEGSMSEGANHQAGVGNGSSQPTKFDFSLRSEGLVENMDHRVDAGSFHRVVVPLHLSP